MISWCAKLEFNACTLLNRFTVKHERKSGYKQYNPLKTHSQQKNSNVTFNLHAKIAIDAKICCGQRRLRKPQSERLSTNNRPDSQRCGKRTCSYLTCASLDFSHKLDQMLVGMTDFEMPVYQFHSSHSTLKRLNDNNQ